MQTIALQMALLPIVQVRRLQSDLSTQGFGAVQYSQFAGARPPDFADSFATGSTKSTERSARRTMRPPQCRFLLRSSYNEKNN
ncbi:hypothetical protein [Methyloceanibacter sp.]|uniref:hypothetical protein n=1 Tax=Methyloceanibacter sp. TaxID=1965321 RepID=UPI003D6CB56F